MEKKKIEEITVGLLHKYGFKQGTDTYVDIVMLAKSLGFKVGESGKLPHLDDGFIAVSKDKQDLIIGVNNARSFEEKRFIVAHELAHYFLHYSNANLEVAVMHREHIKGKGADENDADYFAACILMPQESFKKQYQILLDGNLDAYTIIDKLQEIFKTPRESVERRIKEVC